MKYDIYVDVLFGINFMMDSLCLLLVQRIRLGPFGKNRHRHRALLGGAAGAGLTCLTLFLPVDLVPLLRIALPVNLVSVVRMALLVLVIQPLMAWIGLGNWTSRRRQNGSKGSQSKGAKKEQIRRWIQDCLLLYVAAFLLGGMMEVLRPYIQKLSLFFVVAVVCYYLVLGSMTLLEAIRQKKECLVQVHLYLTSSHTGICLQGMVDTGNVLTDPLSGKPVSVVTREAARTFLGGVKASAIRYIPYETMNGSGVMPVLRIPQMIVEEKSVEAKSTGMSSGKCRATSRHIIQDALLGIGEESTHHTHTFQILVSPKLW